MRRLEFTIEPFEEGHPGPHVTAPVDALRAAGFAVEFGPFGSSASVPPERLGDAVSLLTTVAFEHGASRVNLDVERVGDPTTGGLSG